MTSKVDTGSWNKLENKLSDSTLFTINRLGFKSMSPVQSAVIPLFMSNKDVLVEACTGSGKTLAFIIPIIEKILKRDTPLKKTEVVSIIISPTRELAMQIQQVLQEFLNDLNRKIEIDDDSNFKTLEDELLEEDDDDKQKENEEEEEIKKTNTNTNTNNKINISSLLLIGGTDIYQDLLNFKNYGGNIIIGTPGRTDEFLTRVVKNDQQFKFKEFEMLILDEADRLLDMGFHLPINSILLKLPKQRRTGLFSATQTNEVKELARTGMRNPFKVSVSVKHIVTHEDQSIPSTLVNKYMIVPIEERLNQLVHFLVNHIDSNKIIIYFLTCSTVDYFYKILSTSIKSLNGKPFFSLHGKAPHSQRIKVFDSFSLAKNGCLLATDLAARGLDIPNVDWVLQYDAPQDPKAFVHRIGRTARMGREGNALLFLSPEEDSYIEFLKIKKVPLIEMPKATENVEDALSQVKKSAFQDREIMEKGVIAMVSHVRAYKEHLCPYIFVFHRLSIGLLATGYALLYLPRMPEIRDKTMISEWSSGYTKDQILKISYKEKKKEKQRLEKLEKIKVKKELAAKERQDAINEKKRKAEQLENDKLLKKQESSIEYQLKKQKQLEEKKRQEQESIKEILEETQAIRRAKKSKQQKKDKSSRFSDLMGSDNEQQQDNDEDEEDDE